MQRMLFVQLRDLDQLQLLVCIKLASNAQIHHNAGIENPAQSDISVYTTTGSTILRRTKNTPPLATNLMRRPSG